PNGSPLFAPGLRDRHHGWAWLDGRRAFGRRADRRDRGTGRAPICALGQEHVHLCHPRGGAAVPPAGPSRQTAHMIPLLTDGVPRRGLKLLAGLALALIAAPLAASDYLITVLILIFYFAYVGQAWNIMMGFAGQLSLGLAFYVGLVALDAAALYVPL